jgi:hypothetical protein
MAEWWEDLIGAVNPYVRDVVPGFGAVQDFIGGAAMGLGLASPEDLYPGMIGYQPPGGGGTMGFPGATQIAGGGASAVFGGGYSDGGGASMPSMMNGLALSGPRRIYPYTGGLIPSGYRVANRPPRRATSGYPGGTYLVPRRRMNPLNPRALMRAERRMGAFTHWVKRHFRIAGAMPHRKRKASSFRRKKR